MRQGMLTLTRCLSFEEDQGGGTRLHPAQCPPPTAAPPPLAVGAEAPPPPPPAADAADAWRSARVAQLRGYLQGLGGPQACAGACVELPAAGLGGLVQQAVEELSQCRAQRGALCCGCDWPGHVGGGESVCQPCPAASPPAGWLALPPPRPAPAPRTACAPSDMQDPKLRDAMSKLHQLDAALDAVSQKAAELGQRTEEAAAHGDDDSEAPGPAEACPLVAAMRRERRRLQHAERLQAALQEGERGDWQAGEGEDHAAAEQERLVEAVLSRMDAAQAGGAAAAADPYADAASQLSAIDAQLAALGGAVAEAGSAGAAAPEASPAPGEDLEECGEADLEALRAGYQRSVRRGFACMCRAPPAMPWWAYHFGACGLPNSVHTACLHAAGRCGRSARRRGSCAASMPPCELCRLAWRWGAHELAARLRRPVAATGGGGGRPKQRRWFAVRLLRSSSSCNCARPSI